ncbi:MAG: sugar transferase [Candidatus Binatia bacterium]
MIKRAFDTVAAFFGLVLLSPLFLVAGLLIKMNSPGPIFFRQERIGRGFRPFYIYKLRTMVQDAPSKGGLITVGQDPRITRVGWFLRRTKIDEFPQLLNVLKGDMSFVGPRPELRKYVELFRQDYEEILKVRPGITDLSSLKYRHEAELLAKSRDAEEEYVKSILPDKLRLAREYLKHSSILFDLTLILKTVPKLFGRVL